MKPQYTKQFKKDVKMMIRQKKDFSEFKEVIRLLLSDKKLDALYSDHPLTGFSVETRECHRTGLVIGLPTKAKHR